MTIIVNTSNYNGGRLSQNEGEQTFQPDSAPPSAIRIPNIVWLIVGMLLGALLVMMAVQQASPGIAGRPPMSKRTYF